MSKIKVSQSNPDQNVLEQIKTLLIEDEKIKKEAATILHENKTVLSALRLFVQKIDNEIKSGKMPTNNSEQFKQLIDDMIKDLRQVSNNLYPGLFKHFGFSKSLLAFKSELARQELVAIECNDLIVEEPTIEDVQSLFIYRLFAATLNYLHKAECKHITINLSCFNNCLCMEFMTLKPRLNNEYSEAEINLIKARALCANAIIDTETNWQDCVKITIKL